MRGLRIAGGRHNLDRGCSSSSSGSPRLLAMTTQASLQNAFTRSAIKFAVAESDYIPGDGEFGHKHTGIHGVSVPESR